jgi:hypothetical protein
VLESVLGNEMDGDTDEEQTILKKLWNGDETSRLEPRFARCTRSAFAHQRGERKKMTAAAGRCDGQVLEERPSGVGSSPAKAGFYMQDPGRAEP